LRRQFRQDHLGIDEVVRFAAAPLPVAESLYFPIQEIESVAQRLPSALELPRFLFVFHRETPECFSGIASCRLSNEA
jgi:hypothetical protein